VPKIPKIEGPVDESLESILKHSSSSEMLEKVLDYLKANKNCKLEERQVLTVLGSLRNDGDQKKFLKEVKDRLRSKPDGGFLYEIINKLHSEGNRLEVLKILEPLLDIKKMGRNEKMRVIGCQS
jgi:hypothetical protein